MTGAVIAAVLGLLVGALASYRWNVAMTEQARVVARIRLSTAHGRVRFARAETAVALHRVAALSALLREFEHDLAGADREIAELEQDRRVDREFDRITAGLRPASGTTNT